jgi:peptidoglycan/LPS O-acetylase OafA/YrhL
MSRVKWFSAVRAYGLFLVLGYHLFYDRIPGGFLGVDIFFTFSGFLITSIILEEVRKNGDFALFRFYKRRVRRILVPLFLALTFTLPFALLISSDFTVGISRQLASALSFTSNWYNIVIGSSYEAQLLPPLYIHTWSLALEMQFYLAWGLICAGIMMLSKVMYKENPAKRYVFAKIIIAVLSGLIAVGSFIYMELSYWADIDLNTLYFSTFSRFFPFFIGALAAAIWGMEAKQDEILKQRVFSKHPKAMTAFFIIITLLAAAVILFDFSQHKFTDEFIFHYGFLFTSLLTVVLIYGTHGLDILTPPSVKEPRLLKAAADISYDMYLFHWPLYVIFSALILHNTAASLVTLAVSVLFSALMVYGAERVLIPSRHDTVKHPKAARAVICVSVAAAVIAGGVVVYRAPVITSIEADFASGHIVQDTNSILSVKRGIDALNLSPVAYAAVNTPLSANLLPESEKVTAPEPPVEQEPPPAAAASAEPGAAPAEPAVGAPHTEPTAGASHTEPAAGASHTEPPPAPVPDASMAGSITGGVTVIGDSVPLGAQTAMINTIPDCYVDAVVSRPVKAGVGIMTDLQNNGELREHVVIALGTNGTNSYAKLLTEIIDALNPGHRLIFVTPFDGRSNENAIVTNSTAEWMRELPGQYNFITVADWNALISTQVNLLAGDKVHMGGQTSMKLYADMVAEAVYRASQGPAK